jgi:tetratricopeptide (TPR) repeat protein
MASQFQEANLLLRTGKLEEAVAAYRAATEENTSFYAAYQNLGETLWKLGRLDEAIAAFRQAVALNPGGVWCVYKLGELLRLRGEFEEAVGYLRRAVELKSDVAEFHLGLGAALVKLGEWTEGEGCLRRVLQFSTSSIPTASLSEAYYFLGVIKSEQQQGAEAVDWYRRGWEIHPGSVDCCLALAKALGQLGRWDEAVDWYRQGLVFVESGEVVFALGQALAQLQRWDEAIAEYQGAIALGFAGAEVRHHLGYAFSQLGRYEEAVVEFRQVVEVNPKSAQVRHQLGYGLMQLGRLREAALELRKAVELYPRSAVVWQQLGDVLRELGKEDKKAVGVLSDGLNLLLAGLPAVNVLQFTPPKTRNPFYTIIATELIKHTDIDFRFTTNRDDVIKACVLKPKHTVIHFHQLDPLYHPGDQTEQSIRQRAESLLDFLREIKKVGGKIVWTKHNPVPHNQQFASIDIELEQKVLDIVDQVIVLGYGAKAILSSICSPNKITVIPHPAFDLVYGPLLSKLEARCRIGVETNSFLFGSIGEIKPYKGLEFMIKTFAELTSEKPAPMLIIAGNPASKAYVDQLKVNLPNNVVLQDQEIAFDEMSAWICSLDASIFSFKDIWASGSVILSISYQTPVIVPDIGLLREYVEQDNTGFFYQQGNRDSLIDAIKARILSPYPDHYQYMCRSFCQKNAITTIANQYRDIYKKLGNIQKLA